MTREKLIEVMARAVANQRRNEFGLEPLAALPRDRASLCLRVEALTVLAALEAAIPGLADVLNGKATIVPVEATDAGKDAIVEVAQIHSGWGVFRKQVSNAEDVYAAMLAASPYKE